MDAQTFENMLRTDNRDSLADECNDRWERGARGAKREGKLNRRCEREGKKG